MRKIFFWFLIAVLLFFTINGIYDILQPKLILNKTITIEEGSSLIKVAQILKKNDIISSPIIFLVLTKLFYSPGSISYGQFNFSGRYNLRQIISTLLKAEIVHYKITFPEGFTSKNIAYKLYKRNLGNFKKFIKLTQDSAFISSLDLHVEKLEGFLFPDTYFIPYYAKEKEIIKMMVENFFLHWDYIYKKRVKFDSLYATLILASIVQREARYADEMGLIAGVYKNRLRKHMRLQADPTVAYALELENKSRYKIYYQDLKIRSIYNTYLYKGLPPTPICNPGLAAIKGALKPKTTDYLFFFAGGNSRHIFSRTYSEHLRKMSRL